MIRLDETKRYEGTIDFLGGDDIDEFEIDIPPDERFMSAHVEVIAHGFSSGPLGDGDAYIHEEPPTDATGRVTLKVRWWYGAKIPRYPASVEYRARVFTRHKDDSVTFLQGMEPLTARRKLVVMGDGFSADEQEDFNDAVRRLVIEGVFSDDLFHESVQAFNIWRLNLISPESPSSEIVWDEKGTPANRDDDTVVSESIRNTALNCIVEGVRSHGWFELPHQIQIEHTLRRMVPDYDYSITICNNPGVGAVAFGPHQVINSGEDWAAIAHEFGHSIGGLLDEYSREGSGAYEGGEPVAANVTVATRWEDLKWRHFVHDATPIPTGRGAAADFTEGPKPATWSDTHDAGLFEGGSVKETGISRPVINCRMKSTKQQFCPVCYTELKDRLHPYTDHTFTYPLVGDFDGSGQHDLVLVMGRGLHRYRRNADQFELTLSSIGQLPGGWSLEPGDRYIVGDFDGDGSDEILVYRYRTQPRIVALLKSDGAGGLGLVWSQTSNIGNWTFGYGDKLLPANWSSADAMDLFWIKPGNAVALMRSTPTGFRKVKSYTQTLPGWWLDGSETFLAGDFDGLGRDDLFVYSGAPGHPPRAAVFRTATNRRRITSLVRVTYDETRFSEWALGSNDQWLAANWYGGPHKGLYVYNGTDWQRPMLATVWANTNSGHLKTDTVYEGSLPGWYLGRNDKFTVAGPRGNSPQGLVVFNCDDWATETLGVVMSDGSNLSVLRRTEMDPWTLSSNDRFLPCMLSSGAADPNSSLFPDTIVHTSDRLAIIDNRHLHVRESYLRWLHRYRYGMNS